MADSELKLASMYERDHDGMVQARALLVGTTKALKAMCAAAAELEAQAGATRDKQLADATALQASKTSSISQLHAEREALVSCLLLELDSIESDSQFSLSQLETRLKRLEAQRRSELGSIDRS